MKTVDQRLERRQITVLMCDLVDSTSLADALDPEDYLEVLSNFKRCCSEVIIKYNGYIARFIGDELLVYFGYPTGNESDAERSVQCALEIVQQLGKQEQRLDNDSEFNHRVRIGISTGLAVIGNIDELEETKALAVGIVPNLAARLRAISKPGEVTISSNTRRLLQDLFEYEFGGKHKLKGIENPESAWHVIRRSHLESRFDAYHSDGVTAIIGRDIELGEVVSRFEKLSPEDGLVVEISGNPGIGKSRFIRSLTREKYPEWEYIGYYGSSIYTNSMLYPAVDQILKKSGIRADAPSDVIREALQQIFDKNLDASLLDIYTSLISGASTGTDDTSNLQMHRDGLFEAIFGYFKRIATGKYLCLVCEDVHWMDSTSVELLGRIIENSEEIGIVILVTYRPEEFIPDWIKPNNYLRIQLDELGKHECTNVIERLTGRVNTAKFNDYIYTKSNGVPLYLESLTQSLLNSGTKLRTREYATPVQSDSFAVPDNLTNLLHDKVNRLGPERVLVQLASALDSKFHEKTLRSISGLSLDKFNEFLDRLLFVGIFKRTDTEQEFQFHHALLQDAAYQSMLREQRTKLHTKIADYVEQHDPLLLDQRPEVVARHFNLGGRTDKAIPLYLRAGKRYQRLSAFGEAVALFNSGLKLVTNLTQTPEILIMEVQLQLALGGAYTANLGYASQEAGEAYQRAKDICGLLGNPPEMVPALAGITAYHAVRGDVNESHAVANTILQLGMSTNDNTSLMFGYRQTGTTLCLLGQFSQSHDYLLKAIELYQTDLHADLAYVYALDYKCAALAYLAVVYTLTNEVEKAKTTIQQAVNHARSIGHIHSEGFSRTFQIGIYALLREHTKVREFTEIGIELSRENGFPMWLAMGYVAQGYSKVVHQNDESALTVIKNGLDIFEKTGSESFTPFLQSMHIEALLHLERFQEAFDECAQNITVIERTNAKWFQSAIYDMQGVAAVGLGISGVEYFRSCKELATQQGAKYLLEHCLSRKLHNHTPSL